MEKNLNVSRNILYNFLSRWPLTEISRLTLENYVGLKNPDTFCQWVEHRTKELGSIQGVSSIKFGIYKRSNPNRRPKLFTNDASYSWQKNFGKNRIEVFENVKKEIVEIIEASMVGQFERIDELRLTNFFKWKIAYLYSNERLIPIFKPDILKNIAAHFGFTVSRFTKISELQKIIIDNKPTDLNIYEYANHLFERFGDKLGTDEIHKRRRTRKATTSRRTNVSQKNIIASYIADFKHDRLQEALKKKLIAQYGKNAVKKEENFVDIKLVLPHCLTFYEIKTASFASDCVKQALGQVLLYVHHDSDSRKKKIVVVGQYPPNQDDRGFIEYIQKLLQIEFTYEHVSI